QALEAFSLERRIFGVSDTALNFSFSIGILDPAGEGDGPVMGEHVAIQGIGRGVVDARNQHTLAQLVQHQNARRSATAPKSFLVELGRDGRSGSEREQPYCLAAIAQREHKQAGASILAALRFAYHRPTAIIDLTLFSWSSENHRPCWRYLGSAQFISKAPN